jgi:hypothetical protein
MPLDLFRPHYTIIIPALVDASKILDWGTNTEIENPEHLIGWSLL